MAHGESESGVAAADRFSLISPLGLRYCCGSLFYTRVTGPVAHRGRLVSRLAAERILVMLGYSCRCTNFKNGPVFFFKVKYPCVV